ncbi:MAG: hypothetical protein MUE75_09490, partial [Algoriphagus sp.]|nr:hypothetical protein [Algoriphagus sp.]
GRLLNCEPSRFLEEVDPATIKVNKRMSATKEMPGALRREGLPGAQGFIGIKKQPEARPASTLKIHSPSPDFKPSNTNNLQAGQLVEHPKFGFGKVQKIETEGLNKKATIDFEHFGEKTSPASLPFGDFLYLIYGKNRKQYGAKRIRKPHTF